MSGSIHPLKMRNKKHPFILERGRRMNSLCLEFILQPSDDDFTKLTKALSSIYPFSFGRKRSSEPITAPAMIRNIAIPETQVSLRPPMKTSTNVEVSGVI